MKEIMWERGAKAPRILCTLPDTEASFWLEDRAMLARAIGYETKLSSRVLYVLDDGEVMGVYFYR